MNALKNSLQIIPSQIIELVQNNKKKKYLGTLIKKSMAQISKDLKKIDEENIDNFFSLKENLDEILSEINKLASSKFFKRFGEYFENKDIINKIISSINLLIDTLNDDFHKNIAKILFDSFYYSLIDETLGEISSGNLPLPKKNIKHEFTYIFLGLDFDKEEEKNEEENKSNFKNFYLTKKEFKRQVIKLVKKFDLDQRILSKDNLRDLVHSFEDPSKITLENLEEFFSEKFILHPLKAIHLKLLKSKENEEKSIKIYYDSCRIGNDQTVPLKTPGIMLFGRKAKSTVNELDFFLGESASISRKQFAIILDENLQNATIKCFSEINHTNFLMNGNKFYLEPYHLITFGTDHSFYVRESHNCPIENSSIPFKKGSYLAIKGIGTTSEYLDKKILIRTKECGVNEQKENFHKIFILDKTKKTVIIGEDLKFKDKAIDQNHANIGYDAKKDKWYIKSGSNEQDFFKTKQTTVDVVKFNDTKNYDCKEVLLQSGNIINIEDYSFELL